MSRSSALSRAVASSKRIVAVVAIAASVASASTAAAQTAAPARTERVDVWSYVKGDVGSVSIPGVLSQSTHAVSPDEVVYARTDSLQVTYRRDREKGRVGVVMDGNTRGNRWLRCFGDTPHDCRATFGPSSMPLFADLPVLPATSVSPNSVNPGGAVISANRSFYVNPIDTNRCGIQQSGGSINQSITAYLLDSYDFGGDIGRRDRVLVLELVSGLPPRTPNPFKGQRLERYWFVQGLGYVREEGWEDAACRAKLSVETCSGRYTKPEPGANTWSQISSTAVPMAQHCSNPGTSARAEPSEPRSGFDEDEYLRCNPDVDQAVLKGQTSATEHYRIFGRKEGRRLSC